MYILKEEVIEVPSTCFIIKFNNHKDYGRVYKLMMESYFYESEYYDVFGDDFCEIDIEIEDNHIQDFIDTIEKLKEKEPFNDLFIMTEDLEKEPYYVFI